MVQQFIPFSGKRLSKNYQKLSFPPPQSINISILSLDKMPYQKVFRLDDTVEDEYDNIFIPEEELERLSQEGIEHYLVYFTRHNRYTLLTDFPKKGEYEKVFTGSSITGPLEEDPGEDDDEETEYPARETVVRAIPVEEMPGDDKFEKVEYLKYGLRREHEYISALRATYLSDINRELIKAIGREALQALGHYGIKVEQYEKDEEGGENGGDEKAAGPFWAVYSEPFEPAQALITFEYSEPTNSAGKSTGKSPYPRLELKAFGPEGSSAVVLKKLGLDRLHRAFSSLESRKLGVEELLRKGLQYNLRQEEVELGEVREEERVIL